MQALDARIAAGISLTLVPAPSEHQGREIAIWRAFDLGIVDVVWSWTIPDAPCEAEVMALARAIGTVLAQSRALPTIVAAMRLVYDPTPYLGLA